MHRIKWNFLVTLLTVVIISGIVTASSPATAEEPASIAVYPTDVHLKTVRDRQSLIVQATYANGLTVDVTDQAKMTVANPKLVLLNKSMLSPAADGDTIVKVTYGKHSVEVPIHIEQAKVDLPISFKLDVMPVFMKAGCNTGSCHGAARGKDGFRLSLFGFDPDGDYHRLTREMSGRRINRAIAADSLLVEKAIGSVIHTGGKKIEPGSEMYQRLIRWIESGAKNDPGKVPHVTSLEIYPQGAVLNGPQATQKLNVRAKYSDGTDRDVTSLAFFSSSNDNSAIVTKSGTVTAASRGEAFIMARYETHTIGTRFIVLPKDLKFQWPSTPENNYIDKHINAKLKKLRIIPSELCTDEEFLRRAYLDVAGVLPSPEEHQRFMSNKSPKKREELIDELLGRKEFVELWVMKWAERLAIRSVRNRVDYKPMLLYYNWLQERIANNVPIDVMCRELLASKGGTFDSPATNFYQAERDTLKTAENVAQIFMGMRIQCAQCHNHPFDRWTMDDYYSFAAFFSQIGRKRAGDPREQIIYNRGSGGVRHPVGNRNMNPKYLGGEQPELKGEDRRVVLANWLASDDNPYFATNLANFVWAHFFGKGIVDEVDDVRISNPPVNAQLLAELSKRFSEYRYDFKKIVRDICLSRTYQLSTKTNETNATDQTNFSHAMLRRVRAEVLLDAISSVTDTQDKFRGLPLGARAVQIADGNTTSYFLSTFGRAKRESVCTCEVRIEPNLSQALHMLNGSTVNQKIVTGKLVATRLKEKKTPQQIAEEIYIRALSRKPTPKELAELNKVFKEEEKDIQKTLDDVFWAVLNSREFVFNH